MNGAKGAAPTRVNPAALPYASEDFGGDEQSGHAVESAADRPLQAASEIRVESAWITDIDHWLGFGVLFGTVSILSSFSKGVGLLLAAWKTCIALRPALPRSSGAMDPDPLANLRPKVDPAGGAKEKESVLVNVVNNEADFITCGRPTWSAGGHLDW
jgi:hypothetical protein